MPEHQIFSEVDIEAAQERFAREYRLSRQEAVMLALLVKLPTVTPSKLHMVMGDIDCCNLVSRLRKRLKTADDAVMVQTLNGFGYCLDPATRLRLAGRPPSTVQRPIGGEVST